ncbi:hypothetical protein DQB62_00605 [Shigella flexneri]|nr:hypothetical protein [Shigella flexneri]
MQTDWFRRFMDAAGFGFMPILAVLYVMFCVVMILWVVSSYLIKLSWGSIWRQRECEWRN